MRIKHLLSAFLIAAISFSALSKVVFLENPIDDSSPGSLRDLLFGNRQLEFNDTIVFDPARLGTDEFILEGDLFFEPYTLIGRDNFRFNGRDNFTINDSYPNRGPQGRPVPDLSGDVLRFENIIFENMRTALTLDNPIPIIIDNCTFRNNTGDEAGAIQYFGEGSIYIYNSTFEGNNGSNNGAVSLGSNFSQYYFYDCQFNSNRGGSSAGAIFAQGGQFLEVVNCSFDQNIGQGTAGAIHAERANAYLDSCSFKSNRGVRGGGFFLNQVRDDAAVFQCVFEENIADNGGGIYSISAGGDAGLYLHSTTFIRNDANQFGAGAFLDQGSANVQNCTFFENGQNNCQRGGGVYMGNSGFASFYFNTFYKNIAQEFGGGICVSDAASTDQFANNIIIDNAAGADGPDLYADLPNESDISSEGNNFISDERAGPGFFPGSQEFIGAQYQDPGLDPNGPTNNGGFAPSIRLIECNTLDIGFFGRGTPLTEDQTGRPRRAINDYDAGAYEYPRDEVPVVTAADRDTSYIGNPVAIFQGANITNDCPSQIISMNVIIRNGTFGDELSIPGTPLVSSYDPQAFVYSISGTGTLSDFIQAIDSLKFSSNLSNTSSVTRIIDVIVRDNGGNSTPLRSQVVILSPPAISGFSPSTAGIGDTILVRGANFYDLTDVAIGGNSITNFWSDDSVNLYFVVPSANYSGQLTVTNSFGQGSSEIFTTATPSISDITPAAGAHVGDTVTLSGDYFRDINQVLLSGSAVSFFEVVDKNTIRFVVPDNVGFGQAIASISVRSPAGIGAAPSTYTVLADRIQFITWDRGDFTCQSDTFEVIYEARGGFGITDSITLYYALENGGGDTTVIQTGITFKGNGVRDTVQLVIPDVGVGNTQAYEFFFGVYDFGVLSNAWYNSSFESVPLPPDDIIYDDTSCLGAIGTFENNQTQLRSSKTNKIQIQFPGAVIWELPDGVDFETTDTTNNVVDVRFNQTGQFDISVRDVNECGIGLDSTFTVEVIGNPLPVQNVNIDDSTFCGFGTDTIRLSNFDPTVTGFTWSTTMSSTLTPLNIPLNSAASISYFSPDSGYVYFTATNQCGDNTDSVYIKTNEQPSVFFESTSPSGCIGDSLRLPVGVYSGVFPITYYYEVNGRPLISRTVDSAVTDTIVMFVESSFDSIRIDRAEGANGCIQTGSNFYDYIFSNEKPTLDSITFLNEQCEGDGDSWAKAYYTIPPQGFPFFGWYEEGEFIPFSNSDSVGTLAPGIYEARIQSGSCQDTAFVRIDSGAAFVAPTFRIDGPRAVCGGDDVTYIISDRTNAGMSPQYSWSAGSFSQSSTDTLLSINVSTDTTISATLIPSTEVCSSISDTTISINVQVTNGASRGNLDQTLLDYCSGDSLRLTLSGHTGDVEWQTIEGGVTSSVGMTSVDSIVWVSSQNNSEEADSVLLFAAISSTCDTVYSDTALVIIHPVPSFTGLTDQSVCQSDSSTFSITNVRGNSILWEIEQPLGSNSWNTLASTDSTVDIPPTGDTSQVRVTVSFGNACSSASDSALLNANPDPAIVSITGADTADCSAPEVYRVTPFDGDNYAWTVPNGATISIQNGDSVEVSFGFESGQISVLPTTSNGCIGDTAFFDVVLENCGPVAEFTFSADTVCPDESIQLISTSSNVFGLEGYRWRFNGVDQGINDDTISATFTNPGTYTIEMVVIENGFRDSASVVIFVDSVPEFINSISGPSLVCAGLDTNTYQLTASNNTESFNWFGSGISNINQVGATANITFNESAYIYAQITNACGSNIDSLIVNVDAAPVDFDIIGPSQICPNTTITYTSNFVATTYNWSSVNSTVLGGDTNDSLTVEFGITDDTVSLTASNFCGDFSTNLPIEIGVISAEIQFARDTACLGDTIPLSVVNIDGFNYTWNESGGNGNTLAATATGDYFVELSDGNCTGFSDTVSLYFDDFTIDVFAQSDTSVCADSLAYDFSPGLTTIGSFSYIINLYDANNPDVLLTTATPRTDNSILFDEPGNYAAEVTNDLGCVATDIIGIGVLPGFVLVNDDTLQDHSILDIDVIGNDQIYIQSYNLSEILYTNSNADISIISQTQISYVPQDDFSGQDQFRYVIENNDCPDQLNDTATVTVIVNPVTNDDSFIRDQNNVYIDLNELLVNDLGNFSTINFLSTTSVLGGQVVGNSTDNWFVEYNSAFIEQNLGFTITDSVQYEACDILTCDTSFVSLTVVFPPRLLNTTEITELDLEVTIISKLSPNGDGNNDFFEIVLTNTATGERILPASSLIHIYTKWGDLVSKIEDYDPDEGRFFDGVHYTNGELLPEGTYYYVFEFDLEGERRPETITGFLLLKR